jgi:predicted RecA/RadA family phage recombinase
MGQEVEAVARITLLVGEMVFLGALAAVGVSVVAAGRARALGERG